MQCCVLRTPCKPAPATPVATKVTHSARTLLMKLPPARAMLSCIFASSFGLLSRSRSQPAAVTCGSIVLCGDSCTSETT